MFDEFGERVEVGHRVAHRPSKREPVRDQAEEDGGRLERDVVADALRGQAIEPVLPVCSQLFLGAGDELLERRIRVDAPSGFELHAEPVRILVGDLLEERAKALLEPDLGQPLVRLDRELEEDRLLVGEVVEDRAAREAGDLLEDRDGRPLVAVARERPLRALEDLGPAAFLVLGGDLRHIRTLQNRTDVLLSSA